MNATKIMLHDPRRTATRIVTPGKAVVPHKAFMAITVLEMEKVRKEIERDALLVRLGRLNTRLHAMEAEKAVLLKGLGKILRPKSRRQFHGSSFAPLAGAPAAEAGGFKFQY
jgi:hypothetical protein